MKPEPVLKPSVSSTQLLRRRRERWLGGVIVLASLVLGGLCQLVLPHGPVMMIVVAGVFSVLLLAPALGGMRGLRDTIASFRFAGILLAVLGAAVVAGTLLPPYEQLFHTLWFAALLGLLVAAVIISTLRRFPPNWKTLGFFLCHVGLLLILGGGALSSVYAVRGRLDLHAGGGPADIFAATAGGKPTGEHYRLPFTVALDDFRVDAYAPEYRVNLYQVQGEGRAKQLAAFDRDVDVVHRLPDGASYRIKAVAGPRAVLIEISDDLGTREGVLGAGRSDALFFGDNKALTFEKRDDDIKAYRSALTIEHDGKRQRAALAVNAPVEIAGWSLYQANFNPNDPGYSGLDVVHDPGIPWVFAGFALVAFGVPYMLNVAPWLRRRAAQETGVRP